MQARTLLRTVLTYDEYKKKRHGDTCFICRTPNPDFRPSYWKIIANDYPYDAVAEKHTLLVPIRHFGNKDDMLPDEEDELKAILALLNDVGEYDAILENFTKGRTFLAHYHLHLLKWKRE